MKTLALYLLLFGSSTVYAERMKINATPVPQTWGVKGQGKTYLLYRGMNLRPLSQNGSPSCVGCAVAKALEITHGVKFSPEWLYGRPREYFGYEDGRPGAFVAHAAASVRDVGAIPAGTYAALGINVNTYSPERADVWARGPPDSLDRVAGLYKSRGIYKITTWEQFRGSIASGYPVVIGSNVGFGSRTGQVRNKNGFLRRRWWSRWNHAQVAIGVSDQGDNKGALILNSWGTSWVSGAKRFSDEPAGSYWVRKRDIQRMLRGGDSYVILPLTGLPVR